MARSFDDRLMQATADARKQLQAEQRTQQQSRDDQGQLFALWAEVAERVFGGIVKPAMDKLAPYLHSATQVSSTGPANWLAKCSQGQAGGLQVEIATSVGASDGGGLTVIVASRQWPTPDTTGLSYEVYTNVWSTGETEINQAELRAWVEESLAEAYGKCAYLLEKRKPR